MHNEKYFDEKEEENLNSSSDEGNASYISSKDEGRDEKTIEDPKK